MSIIRPIIRPIISSIIGTAEPFTPQKLFTAGALGGWWSVRPENAFSDTAGTLPAGFGTTAARVNGHLLNATQATAGQRPVYGRRPPRGVVNKLLHTENPTNAYWTSTIGTITEGVADPFGGTNAFTLTATGTNQVWRRLFQGIATDHVASYWIRRSTGTGAITRWMLKGNLGGTVTLDGTWQRQHVVRTDALGTDDMYGFQIGTSGDAIDLYGLQVEEASALSDYQVVGANTYDVFERGGVTRYYLEDDIVDDAMNVTMPDLGSNATIAWASNTGVTIQTGQTVGAGAYDILRNSQLSEFVAINRALTAGETSSLTTYLNGRLGS